MRRAGTLPDSARIKVRATTSTTKMSTTPFLTAGRLIFTALSLSNIIAPYLADFNESHVYNPKWPPHARFHNGQTMSMGVGLGLLTLYFAWRPVLSSAAFTKSMLKDHVFFAALAGSLYWVTGLSAGFYPGTKYLDPDLVGSKYDQKFFGQPAQMTVFTVHFMLAWVAYGFEMRRLGGLKAQ